MNESLFTVSPNCFETSQIINKAQAKTKKNHKWSCCLQWFAGRVKWISDTKWLYTCFSQLAKFSSTFPIQVKTLKWVITADQICQYLLSRPLPSLPAVRRWQKSAFLCVIIYNLSVLTSFYFLALSKLSSHPVFWPCLNTFSALGPCYVSFFFF